MRALHRHLAVLSLGLALGGCTGSRDLDAPDPARRAAALRALARSGDDRVLAALLVAQEDRSVEVRLAAAEAYARVGGPRAAEGLGALLRDRDPAVVERAAAGLAALPADAGGKERLLAAYAWATPEGRAAIAVALERIGAALREAIEVEARLLWERNLAAIERADGAARAGAAEELGESGRAEAVTRLLVLLDGPARAVPRLAAGAARGLGASGHRTVRLRLERLLADASREVAEAAADALRALGDPAAAEALAGVAEGAGPVATAALEALESLPKAPEVAVALCSVAVRSGVPSRAAQAARLARVRDEPCPERPLLARLGRPGEVAALAALAELRLGPPAAASVGQRLAMAVTAGRGEPATQVAMVRALGGLGWPGAAEHVIRRAVQVQKRLDELRAKVAPAAVGPPPTFLETPEVNELGALLAAGGRLRAEGVEPLLERGRSDPAVPIRAGAIEGLGWQRGAAALTALGQALDDAAPEVRRAAALALGRLGDAGVSPLVGAASRTKPDQGPWRIELAKALAETGGPEATRGLAALLEGESTEAAAMALSRLGASAGARPLLELVTRPGAQALPEGIEALAHVGGAEAGGVIAAHLTSDRADVREAAVRALGRLRYERASTRLEALRNDYFGRVRRASIEALSKLPAGRPGGRP